MRRNPTPHRGPRRGGFTIIEVLVVICILLAILALGIGVYVKVYDYMDRSKTDRTMQRVHARLDRLMEQLAKDAKTMDPKSSAEGGPYTFVNGLAPYQLATGRPLASDADTGDRDRRRARVIFHKYLIRWSMPQNFAELNSAINANSGHPLATGLARRLTQYAARPNYGTYHKQQTEAGAILFMILEELGATGDFTEEELKDTDGDGIKEVVDAWGSPLVFLRWGNVDQATANFPGPIGQLNLLPLDVTPTLSPMWGPNGVWNLTPAPGTPPNPPPFNYRAKALVAFPAQNGRTTTSIAFDPEDPERLLSDRPGANFWNTNPINGQTQFRNLFGYRPHGVYANQNNLNDPPPVYAPLVIISAGADKLFNTGDDLDTYAMRLTTGGQ